MVAIDLHIISKQKWRHCLWMQEKKEIYLLEASTSSYYENRVNIYFSDHILKMFVWSTTDLLLTIFVICAVLNSRWWQMQISLSQFFFLSVSFRSFRLDKLAQEKKIANIKTSIICYHWNQQLYARFLKHSVALLWQVF